MSIAKPGWWMGLCAAVLAGTPWGCAQVLGVNEDYHLHEGSGGATTKDMGSGGASGASSATSASGTTSSSGTTSASSSTTSTGTGGLACSSASDCPPSATACCNGACRPVVASIAAGAFHTCARLTDGSLWCWGRDDRGQLGNGAGADRATPAEVPGLGHGVTAAAAGYAHTCALLTDGTLWCWGRNDYGQLGDGTTNDSVAPVQVSALGTNVVEVAAGTFHTCARLNDGTVSCWGRDYYGQLGDGMVANQASPVPVTALGNGVAEIVAGTSHTCARKTDGSVWCWGRNYIGELGVGSTANHATPVPVTALSAGAVQLAAGDDHTCARFADGTVQCWGSGTSGECGDGSTSDHLSPVLAGAATGPYVDVAAGWDHTCARTGTGLWCWGSNGEGELGDGSTTSRSSPEQISAVGAKVTQVAAGDSHTCAREDDGTVWCWGRNDFAQLGHPGGPYSSLAVQVAVIGACP